MCFGFVWLNYGGDSTDRRAELSRICEDDEFNRAEGGVIVSA